jgi:SAM-dependent methyltransferase
VRAQQQGGPEAAAGGDPQSLYGRWYYANYPVPYDENEHWKQFFGQVADAIVRQLAPKTVLDAGCAKGFLVAALRERGVDATGFDLSEFAIANAPEAVRPFLRTGSLTEPIEGQYDLVTCIEVIEHLDPADSQLAVKNLCAAADHVLLSSTPGDLDEPSHVNVRPPEQWAQLFAGHGSFRNFHHDASYLSPWAVLYSAGDARLMEVVVDYERSWARLRQETLDQRRALLDLQRRCEEMMPKHELVETLKGQVDDLRKEILRLRDSLVGKEAELGTALGRAAEFHAILHHTEDAQERLEQVLASRSWRLTWAVGRPLRRLRSRRSQANG